jgi:hypothetical protein
MTAKSYFYLLPPATRFPLFSEDVAFQLQNVICRYVDVDVCVRSGAVVPQNRNIVGIFFILVFLFCICTFVWFVTA